MQKLSSFIPFLVLVLSLAASLPKAYSQTPTPCPYGAACTYTQSPSLDNCTAQGTTLTNVNVMAINQFFTYSASNSVSVLYAAGTNSPGTTIISLQTTPPSNATIIAAFYEVMENGSGTLAPVSFGSGSTGTGITAGAGDFYNTWDDPRNGYDIGGAQNQFFWNVRYDVTSLVQPAVSNYGFTTVGGDWAESLVIVYTVPAPAGSCGAVALGDGLYAWDASALAGMDWGVSPWYSTLDWGCQHSQTCGANQFSRWGGASVADRPVSFTDEFFTVNAPAPAQPPVQQYGAGTIFQNAGVLYDTFLDTYNNVPTYGNGEITWALGSPLSGQKSFYWVNLLAASCNSVCATATFTPTRTFTSTPTVTASSTPTLTGTSTSTGTITSTNTVTGTPTSTFTPTDTSTSTPTASFSFTATPSFTPTVTFTPTATYSFTATATPSFTFTPSNTPTFTPTSTFTSTNTPTPTGTSTFTPTDSMTPTPSFTSTSTPTDTATPTSTFSPTATDSFTVTSTPTASFTPSFTWTSTDTPTATFSFTPTPSFTPTFSPTSTFSPTATFSYTITSTPTSSSTPTFTPTFTNTPTPTSSFTATFSPTASSTGTSTYSPTITFTPTSTGTPTATQAPKPYHVLVRVYNAAGELVKLLLTEDSTQPVTGLDLDTSTLTSLSGPGSLVNLSWNGSLLATWNGTTASGQPVSNGVYYIRVDSIDGQGNVVSAGHSVTVSRTFGSVSVVICNEAGEVVRHLYGAQGMGGPVTAVQLSSSVLKLGSSGQGPMTIGMDNGVTLTWDGTGAGGADLTTGVYFLEVFSNDGTGAMKVITDPLTVIDTDGSGEGVTAYPNAWKPGDPSLTFKALSSPTATLAVKLYDLAGERVTTFTGASGTGQANYDPSRLASGIYIALVESRDPNGSLISRQALKVMVRH